MKSKLNTNIMAKTLKVIEPFCTMSVGDKLELSKDGNNYEYSRSDEFNKIGKDGETYSSSFESTMRFSPAFVKELIRNGFLVEETTDKQEFVNIFTEIDNLLNHYTEELSSINTNMKGCQECVKLEKTTVLNNLITLLTYLKGLKK